jgi:hypothetical protein
MLLATSRLSDLFVLSSLAVLAQFTATVSSLFVLARRGAEGLGRKHVLLAVTSLAGIVLVARGAELRQAVTAAGVVLFGEVLRVAIRRGAAEPA